MPKKKSRKSKISLALARKKRAERWWRRNPPGTRRHRKKRPIRRPSQVFKILDMVRNKTRKKKSKTGKKQYRSKKTLNKIRAKNTAKAKCVTLTKGTWNKKRKHCLKNPKCFWSGQLDICLSKKKY